ncbi:U-box domain-containing protein 3 [Linum grandiflorum]
MVMEFESVEEWLSHAQEQIPLAIEKARQVKGLFPGRWKTIISKLEQISPLISELSRHPCFSKNPLCKEQLQSASLILNETVNLAELCLGDKQQGKLKMQSDLDSLSGKLDLNLKDCGLLIKTAVLAESPSTISTISTPSKSTSKHRALDSVVEFMKEDEKGFQSVVTRSNVAALVQLLTATSPRIREKTVTLICSLVESGTESGTENWLVSENVLPPLIRLIESGTETGKEKAIFSLQRLSMESETARSIVGHGGIQPLIELCQTGDSVSQAAAACTLKNISAVAEVRQSLADEGAVKVTINLLDSGILLGTKEYAAECLQNLTASNESLRRMVISEGGIRSLLTYLDSNPLPQEPAIAALRNLVNSVSAESLVSSGFFPRIVHVLKSGSLGAQQAATSAICKLCASNPEMKKLTGEAGCIPLLVKLLEAKSNGAREASAQAISSLMTVSQNVKEVKKDYGRSVPSLVQLLDAAPQNTAKKYAVACLSGLSSSRKCRKMMVSYGASGYLKKLTEMDVVGSKKLLERLERGKIRSLFIRK